MDELSIQAMRVLTELAMDEIADRKTMATELAELALVDELFLTDEDAQEMDFWYNQAA